MLGTTKQKPTGMSPNTAVSGSKEVSPVHFSSARFDTQGY